MSRKKYLELKSILHFNDNKNANENKGYAIQNKAVDTGSCAKLPKIGIFQENLSFDCSRNIQLLCVERNGIGVFSQG
jgi:hypothetical protein